MNSEFVKALKQERKLIESFINSLETDLIPPLNGPESDRFRMIGQLLHIARRWPFNADLVKAALELNAYNDRVAVAFLRYIVVDYKGLIKRAKRDG